MSTENLAYTKALDADRVDTKQSYGVIAIAHELQESNKLKAEENKIKEQEVNEVKIANRLEFLKILREEKRYSEYDELLNIIGTEVLR